MEYERAGHHRRSIRLQGYDYAQAGAYYLTLVTQGRQCLFGEIRDDHMRLSKTGKIAETCWRDIPAHFPNVELGAFVVMPNHIHGIIILHERSATPTVGATHHRADDVGATQWVAPTNATPTKPHGPKRGSIGAIIGAYKMAVTRKIVEGFGGAPRIWQRNYYEHIVRGQKDLEAIWRYIMDNPLHWNEDREYIAEK